MHIGIVWPLLLVAAILAGCSRGVSNTATDHVSLRISPSPASVGLANIEVTLSTTQGAPLSGATLQIRGDMTHAGMEPVFANCLGEGNGRYLAKNFNFDMAGDWILTVSGTLPDGGVVNQQFSINGVGGEGTPMPSMAMSASPSASRAGG